MYWLVECLNRDDTHTKDLQTMPLMQLHLEEQIQKSNKARLKTSLSSDSAATDACAESKAVDFCVCLSFLRQEKPGVAFAVPELCTMTGADRMDTRA